MSFTDVNAGYKLLQVRQIGCNIYVLELDTWNCDMRVKIYPQLQAVQSHVMNADTVKTLTCDYDTFCELEIPRTSVSACAYNCGCS